MSYLNPTIPLIACLILISACAKSSSDPTNAPAQGQTKEAGVRSEKVVSVVTGPVEISAGDSGEAIVQVKVQNGYHINANPPTYPYLKATEVEVKPGPGLSVGFITYPNPITKKFPFAEEPVAVYEGDTQLKVLLKAAASAPKGTSNLPGKLKVQACDDQVCYPPGEVDITIPVTIK